MSPSSDPQSLADRESSRPLSPGQSVDWRDQVTAHPGLSVVLAFGAGLAVAGLFSSAGKADKERSSAVWSGLKAAAIGLAARQTMRYAQRHFGLTRS